MASTSVTRSEASIATRDGLRLATRRWAPPAAARATVLIVHGLSEHAGRYEHVARHLCEGGFAVAGYDHRGHGRSEGRRGSLARPDDLLRDLETVVDALRGSGAGRIVLLGQSMGGAIAGRFVAEERRPVAGLVLCSPALQAG
jgi:alpha-beta hydrolase superfamily lysophospholipase